MQLYIADSTVGCSAISGIASATKAQLSIQDFETAQKCPCCGFERTSSTLRLRRTAHREIFRCWEQKPANQAKRQRQGQASAHLLESQRLTEWGLDFLRGKRRKLSPKQLAVIERIEKEVGGAV